MELPEWLKKLDLPEQAARMALAVYKAVLAKAGDADKAMKAALAAATGDAAPRQASFQFRAGQALDETGLRWEAVLIAPGLSEGWPVYFWSDEVLEAAVGVFQGVDINAYELTADFFSHIQMPPASVVAAEDVKKYLTARKVGWVDKAWYEPGLGVKAEIQFVPEQAWMPKTLQDGQNKGNPDVLGLSIDARIRGFEFLVENLVVVMVTKILSCSSVDVVTRPAAGGKFLRAVAGLDNPNPERREMDLKKLLDLIKSKRPDLLEGKDQSALGEDEVLKLAQMAMNEPPEKKGENKDKDKAPAGNDSLPGTEQRAAMSAEDISKQIAQGIKEVELRAACGRTLDQVLDGSGLPDLARARVREKFEAKVFERADLDKAVKGEKDYLASMAVPGFSLDDQARISGGLGTVDRIGLAIDLMFGLTPEDIKDLGQVRRLDGQPVFQDMRAAQSKDYDGVPRLSGIRELYQLVTGDTEVRGFFVRSALPADMRAAQDITSATFTYLLGNTMGRRLVKDYRAANFGEDLLISVRKPVKDFRTQEAVLVGGFPDIDDADPESGNYAEIAGVTDEESTYAIGQKGNILTITRKLIINDDVSLILRLLTRLAQAARRTHAKYVWDKFMSNGTCSDGTAWFTTGHGNLVTTALSFAAALAAYQALAKMTEKDSGERIGLLSDPSVKPTLVYPVDLFQTGESIVNDDDYFASNDLTAKRRNPLKGKISGYQCPLFTDATDWGMLMPAQAVDMVEMGYLNGRQDPEMFVADTPQAEQVFVADKIRHKLRHEYAGAVVDYRSGYKAVVAG